MVKAVQKEVDMMRGGHDERWTRRKVDMLRLKQEEK